MKKYKKEILIGLILLVVFLASRLIKLTALPIFTDEAIYLRWAQIAKNDASWRFISLTDGKQPLFVWFMMIAMKIIHDPLVAGRVVSVIAGFVSMFFMGLLSWELFRDKKISFVSSFLYLIYPSALFYDRMAIMDGLVATLILISVYLEVKLVKKPRLDIALILGMAMGASMLTKTSGFFTLYFIPLLILLIDFHRKFEKKYILKLVGLFGLSAFFSQLYYGILRLSPWFHMIAQKDTTFIYPVSEWLNHPFEFFQGNLWGLVDWLITYISWPVLILIIIALFISINKDFNKWLYLFLWFLIPFLATALFGKVLYPRYIFFMTLPLLILASYGLNRIPYKVIGLMLVILPSVFFDYQILSDITHAPLTPIDKGQYVNDWPAGWGVKESVEILQKEADKGPVAIYTDGTFGLMPYGIELYLVYNKNVYIKGLWPLDENFPPEMVFSANKMPTYFIANQKQNIPASWPFTLRGKWQKGSNSESSLRLYKVLNKK